MKVRKDHILTPEALYHVVVVLALLVLGFSVYSLAHKPLGQVPIVGGDTIKVVPTTGEAGYPVAEFCDNQVGAALTVKKVLFVSPDAAPLSAEYTLDRVLNGVHELVDVKVPLNPDEQPMAVHYDSANVPSDAFVSRDAMDCILKKAK